MREGMCRMAGDVADGLIGHPMCPVRWLDEVVVPNFETGPPALGAAALRSRLHSRPSPTVIDDDESRALDAARRTIAFYSTVRTYKPLWEMHGFAEAAEAAGDAFRKGDLAAVPEQIPDEMVDAYTAAGPLDKVRARVAEVAERGDGVFLTPRDLLHPAGADRRVPAEDHRGLRPGLT